MARRLQTCFSAGDFGRPARSIDAPKGCAVGCRVVGDIEIYFFGGVGLDVRLRLQRKPCHRMERRIHFVPFDTRIFNPEVGVPKFVPIRHLVGVEELDAKIKTAHLAVLFKVSNQFVLQTIRILLIQRIGCIVR